MLHLAPLSPQLWGNRKFKVPQNWKFWYVDLRELAKGKNLAKVPIAQLEVLGEALLDFSEMADLVAWLELLTDEC